MEKLKQMESHSDFEETFGNIVNHPNISLVFAPMN